jgi:hypothetical protein
MSLRFPLRWCNALGKCAARVLSVRLRWQSHRPLRRRLGSLRPGLIGHHHAQPRYLEHDTTETEHLIRYQGRGTTSTIRRAIHGGICHDVPKDIQDSYRLYLALLYSKKPIVTGAFTNKTVQEMIDMLSIFAGSPEAAREKPRAIFDVCPAPPLIWSNFGAGNLIKLARAGIPAEIVSVPLRARQHP